MKPKEKNQLLYAFGVLTLRYMDAGMERSDAEYAARRRLCHGVMANPGIWESQRQEQLACIEGFALNATAHRRLCRGLLRVVTMLHERGCASQRMMEIITGHTRRAEGHYKKALKRARVITSPQQVAILLDGKKRSLLFDGASPKAATHRAKRWVLDILNGHLPLMDEETRRAVTAKLETVESLTSAAHSAA